ncbi:MAG: prephenate dehydratase [Fimbriimonadaceae bacterium]|nr:prephenate dehydratase [Fimbriimonadaceae bacterium]
MPEGNDRNLDDIRRDIDAVDEELISLLNRRVELAREVGLLKGRTGGHFFIPEREHQIHDRLESAGSDLLQPRHLKAIFREIISAARDAERPLQIAYWGPPGTFSELAARTTFGSSAEFLPLASITEVFNAVEHHQADYGITPIENSIAGVVPETLDMFPTTNVKICAETFIEIHHHLGSKAESLDQIRRVFAGPQPAGQCRHWLQAHLPRVEVVDVTPTSAAAARAAEDPESAAIANHLALERSGLHALAEHIQDNANNRTRFVVLGTNEPRRTGRDKTSMMFNLRNRPGELHEVLGSFVRHHVNLMMIESRPAPRAQFEYMFYVDCGGHQADENVQRALKEIRERALELVVLGSYPSTDPNLSTAL